MSYGAWFQLALTAFSGVAHASAQRKAGKAQQSAYEYNAKLTEIQAQQDDLETREMIRRERKLARVFSGDQRARYGASGVATTSGSPVEIMGRDAARLELASLEQARSNEARRRGLFGSAASQRFSGRAARQAGRLASTGSLLSTGANVFGQAAYYRDIGAI